MQIRTRIPKTHASVVQKSSTPSWDDIHTFLLVARAGSLSGAARLLEVEHSTVARRIDALELALSVRLFDRLSRKWQLTAEGHELIERASRLEVEAIAFARTADGLSSLTGTVRVSAPPVFTSHFLVARLTHLRRSSPGITLDLVGESRDADLSRREADLAVRLSRPTDPDLAARQIARMGYGLYATAAVRARKRARWEFLGYDDVLEQVPQEVWLRQYAAGRPIVLRSNDLATLFHAAVAGCGIAVLPHFLAANDARLVRVDDGECPVERTIWLVVHQDVRRSARVRVVADAIGEALARDEAVLRG